ncbi:hypothetical protein HanPI659440_Chr04g0142081 [Helianthus annuus]|nr:hypothetical protein HanPI659440_Chr04g0142081 [Helianthus annuus]
MDSVEQIKADEKLIRIVEEQLKEKEQALKKMHDLERQQDAKQQLETEIEELKGKLVVMKHLDNEDDTALQRQIKKMNDELEAKMKELEVMNRTLAVKESQINHELEEARLELIKLQVSTDMILDDTINTSDMHNKFLRAVQRKARARLLWIAVEQKRKLDAKLKLEMEIDGLKEKLQVVKLSGDEDDTTLLGQIKNMNDELEAKMKEMEVMNQTRA